MPTKEDADAVLKDARAYFKGGQKSTNKAYFKSETSLDNSTVKKAKRNESIQENPQLELMKMRGSNLSRSKNTPINIGKVMIETSITLGNCHEMSCMACYYASKLTTPVKSWVAEIDYPGNHVFCVLSTTKPTWGKLSLMAKDEATDVWIVDVWGGVPDIPSKYFNTLRLNFVEWKKVGKRIGWMYGKNQSKWVEADNGEMVKALWTSKLTYRADDETG